MKLFLWGWGTFILWQRLSMCTGVSSHGCHSLCSWSAGWPSTPYKLLGSSHQAATGALLALQQQQHRDPWEQTVSALAFGRMEIFWNYTEIAAFPHPTQGAVTMLPFTKASADVNPIPPALAKDKERSSALSPSFPPCSLL